MSGRVVLIPTLSNTWYKYNVPYCNAHTSDSLTVLLTYRYLYTTYIEPDDTDICEL